MVPPQLPGKTQSAGRKPLQVTFVTSCCKGTAPMPNAALGIPAAGSKELLFLGSLAACTGGWGAFEWNLAST